MESSEPRDARELNRRGFVRLTLAAAAATAACACGASDALAGPGDKPSRPPPLGETEIGTLADYSADGITDKFLKDKKFVVIRNEGRLYAALGNCTHKNCTLRPGGTELTCPCHGSTFSIQGTPTKGPAKASLMRYQITKKEDGRLVVDTRKSFREKQWEDPKAFVAVT